jgi:hypothetical protein
MKSLNGRAGPGSFSSIGGSDICHLLTEETSMNYETLCNPVPVADIPGFNFDPAVPRFMRNNS